MKFNSYFMKSPLHPSYVSVSTRHFKAIRTRSYSKETDWSRELPTR
jgi:hypothetical protein